MKALCRLRLVIGAILAVGYPLFLFRRASFILYEPEPVCHYSFWDECLFSCKLAIGSWFAVLLTIVWMLIVICLIRLCYKSIIRRAER